MAQTPVRHPAHLREAGRPDKEYPVEAVVNEFPDPEPKDMDEGWFRAKMTWNIAEAANIVHGVRMVARDRGMTAELEYAIHGLISEAAAILREHEHEQEMK